MILISIFISNLTGVSAGYIFILSAYFITKNGIQLIQNSFFGGREAASSCPALLHAVHIYFIVLTNKLYFSVSTGCGMADEHTERSAVAEWDAAFRSIHRAFC